MPEDVKTGEGTPPPAAPVTVEPKAVEAEIKTEIANLKEAIAAQKAKGEITAASESTLQALYEELKLARQELAALKELGQRPIEVSATSKWAKWLPW